MVFAIRAVRSAQGRVKLSRERAEYLRLVDSGWSNYQACRAVGVDDRTGRKWRNGYGPSGKNKGAQPITSVASLTGPSRFLRQADRIHIADRLREGVSIRMIAAELSRSPSTVSREIRRNRHPGNGQYRPHAAQSRADTRRPRPKTGKIAANPRLRNVIQGWLELEWSPEQIANCPPIHFPDQPEMHVSHETIYQALYLQGRGELRRELTRALRTGRAHRKPQRRPDQRQARFATPMVMISDRPSWATDSLTEGDLIIGKDQHSQIGTLVERATRYVLLVHLPTDRTAETVRDALITTMKTLPAQLKRSLTWDQGSEMGLHHQFSIATDLPVYFCDPHSPWQRGSNENTNGLLRQYFPKGTNLASHSAEHLAHIAARLNSRPRKTLGWQTPAERLAKLLATAS